jgi:HEAT repeat protein
MHRHLGIFFLLVTFGGAVFWEGEAPAELALPPRQELRPAKTAVLSLQAQKNDDPKKKKDSLPEGLKALQHPEAKVRYRAAQTLADLGPLAKFATPELRDALKDKNALVRVKAAEALWKIDKTPSAILLPVLLEAMTSPDAGVRAAAPPVIALLGAKAKPALPALSKALKDKELDVKLSAVIALGDLGPVARGTADELLALTADKDFFLLEPFVGSALANLGESVVPALTKALTDKSAERRRVSASALGTMGPGAVPAVGALAEALAHDDPALRQLAARALGKIGPEAGAALPTLEKRLSDKVVAVRIESALATWRITQKATHVGVLVEALGDESPGVRDSACQALAVMKAGAKDAVDPVAKLLSDKDLRIRAVMTLGAIGPAANKSLPQLNKLLQDKDGETRLQAALSVWQISGDATESLSVLEKTLATEAHYSASIVILGEMRGAAASLLPTLVNLYRDEDVPADRKALADAIKKIDAKVAMQLGIK